MCASRSHDGSIADVMDPSEALQRTLDLVRGSSSSVWAHDDVQQIAEDLEVAILALRHGSHVDRARLRMLFAPTGSIQETAVSNGWGDEFLALSACVDGLLER